MGLYELKYQGERVQQDIKFVVVIVRPLIVNPEVVNSYFRKYQTLCVDDQNTNPRLAWHVAAPWRTVSPAAQLAWAPHVAKDAGYSYLFEPWPATGSVGDLDAHRLEDDFHSAAFGWESDTAPGVLRNGLGLLANLNKQDTWDWYNALASLDLTAEHLLELLHEVPSVTDL